MHPWPGERATHGGADEIPLPEGPGRLWLCGKHFVGPDPEAALTKVGADRIVCLCQRDELVGRYPDYVAWMEAHAGQRSVWLPIHDLHAPTLEVAVEFLDALAGMLAGGERVLMHCGAGIGRAGTLACGLLIRMGVSEADARRTVAEARPMGGPEVGAQADLLDSLARIRAPRAPEGDYASGSISDIPGTR